MSKTMPLENARTLPLWRRPVTLLFLMAAAMPVAFATWSALLNNFVIEVASFDGSDIGWLHTVREIPGFFAIGVIAILMESGSTCWPGSVPKRREACFCRGISMSSPLVMGAGVLIPSPCIAGTENFSVAGRST